MAVFNAMITDAGSAIQSRQADGDILQFTRCVAGSGSVDVADLRYQTAVTSPEQDITMEDVVFGEDYTYYTISTILSNRTLSKSYMLRQVGFYVSNPDGGDDVLFAIAQLDVAKQIASALESPAYDLRMSFTFTISNTANIKITVDGSAYATREYVDHKCRLDGRPDEIVTYNGTGGAKQSNVFARDFGWKLFDIDDGSSPAFRIYPSISNHASEFSVSSIVVTDITNSTGVEVYNLESDPNFSDISTTSTPIKCYPSVTVSTSNHTLTLPATSYTHKDARYIEIGGDLFDKNRLYQISVYTPNGPFELYYANKDITVASGSYRITYSIKPVYERITYISGDDKSDAESKQLFIGSDAGNAGFIKLLGDGRLTADNSFADLRNTSEAVLDDGKVHIEEGAELHFHGPAYVNMSGGTYAKDPDGHQDNSVAITMQDGAYITMRGGIDGYTGTPGENNVALTMYDLSKLTMEGSAAFNMHDHSNITAAGNSQIAMHDTAEVMMSESAHLHLKQDADVVIGNDQIALSGVKLAPAFHPPITVFVPMIILNGETASSMSASRISGTDNFSISCSFPSGSKTIVATKTTSYPYYTFSPTINNTYDVAPNLNKYLGYVNWSSASDYMSPTKASWNPALYVDGHTSVFFGGNSSSDSTWIKIGGSQVSFEVLDAATAKFQGSSSVSIKDGAKLIVRSILNTSEVALKAQELYLESISPATTPAWANLSSSEQRKWYNLADDRPAKKTGGALIEASDGAELHLTDAATLNFNGTSVVTMSGNANITMVDAGTINMKHGARIQMEDAASISVKEGGSLNLTQYGSVSATAPVTVTNTVTVAGPISTEADTSIALSGNAVLAGSDDGISFNGNRLAEEYVVEESGDRITIEYLYNQLQSALTRLEALEAGSTN